ncbi:MAG: flagellar assembly protein FliH [Treponemataceae bacterium]|nr:flagellar assembly protein FliH [Treponemataceae bacterium]
MAKSVFRPNEFTPVADKIMLKLSHSYVEETPEVVEETEPEYQGPTVEELKAEADEFKANWEIEKKRMLDEAKAEADRIINGAEQAAFEEVKRQTDQGQVLKNQAAAEAEKLLKDAKAEAEAILAEAKQSQENITNNAYKTGYEEGHEEGFKEGKAEAERLVDRLHLMIEKIMDKREQILSETEQQIVDLVLLMTRKVVKVISENQRNVVMSNIVHALRKVKGRGDVLIHVNMAELALTTEHSKEFLSSVENVKNITIVEDSAVDKGGCIIETDFGSIDARISSQLSELEQKILEISPVKSSVKPTIPTEG